MAPRKDKAPATASSPTAPSSSNRPNTQTDKARVRAAFLSVHKDLFLTKADILEEQDIKRVKALVTLFGGHLVSI